MVQLVGGDSSLAGKAIQKARTSLQPVTRQREAGRQAEEQSVAVSPLTDHQQQELPLPVAGEENGSAQGPASGSSLERGAGSGSAFAGQASWSESASVSSEQWAVMVSSIERVKSYPRLARERGIEGVVHLRFKLKPHGQIDRVEIVKSSGHDILDAASVKTIYRASPLPYVSGWVELPIAYVLK